MPYSCVLARVSMAVNRHHDQGNSYEGQHLIGAGLQAQRFSPLSSWQEAGQHPGRQGAGEGAKNFISVRRRLAKPIPQPHKAHTSSNQATPISTRTHLLIVSLPVG